MSVAPRATVWFPEMSLILVRRATARMPKNHFVFRTAPNWTKPEIKEYLEALYGVKVLRIATVNYDGKVRKFARRKLFRQAAFKKVYVSIADSPPAPRPAIDYERGQLLETER